VLWWNKTGTRQLFSDENGKTIVVEEDGKIDESVLRFGAKSLPHGFVRVDDPILADPLPFLSLHELSVIVLTVDNFAVFSTCIDALQKALKDISHEIVVVCNGTPEATMNKIQAKYPTIEMVVCGRNIGVAKGRNMGVKSATGDVLLFLDDDQIVNNKTIELMITELDTGYDLIGVERWSMDAAGHAKRQHEAKAELGVHDYVGGGGMLMKKEIFEKLKGFDERYYPAYYEDSDLCFRAKVQNLMIGCCYVAGIKHLGHTTLGDARLVWFNSQEVLERNRLEFLKVYGKFWGKQYQQVPREIKKLMLLYDQENWAFHSQAKGFAKYCNLDVSIEMGSCRKINHAQIDSCDRVFIMGLLMTVFPDLASVMKSKSYSTLVHHYPSLAGLNYKENILGYLEHEVNNASKAHNHGSISRMIQKLWKKEFNLNSLYLPAGIDCELFKPVEKAKTKKSQVVLGFCGDTDKELKGFEDIIKPAIEIVNEAGYNVKLKVKSADKLIPHEKMPKFYSDIDIYLCGSSAEGLPTPLLEACSCGIPFVSTDVGVVQEINLQDQNILVDRTATALANGIIEMIEAGDMRQRGALNRKIVEAGWDWKYIADVWGYFLTGDNDSYYQLMDERTDRLSAMTTKPLVRDEQLQIEYKNINSSVKGKDPKVLLIYDEPNWAFHSQAKGLKKHCSLDVNFDMCSHSELSSVSTDTYDILFPMGLLLTVSDKVTNVLRDQSYVTLVHHCPIKDIYMPPENFRAFLKQELVTAKSAKGNASISRTIQSLWKKLGLDTVYLPAGTDCKVFKPVARAKETKPQKNKEYVLGYCGNTKKEFKGYQNILLPALKILEKTNHKFRLKTKGFGGKRVPHEAMADFYADVDIYICVSSAEGLPTPLMEACSCGIPFVSTDVGVVKEINLFNQNVVVDRSPVDVANGIVKMIEKGKLKENGALNRKIVEAGWDWKYIANLWAAFIIGDVEKFQEAHQLRDSRLNEIKVKKENLSKSLTVFVITVGNPNYENCIEALKNQDCDFNLEIIKDQYPMDKAFQQMITKCKTKYYIQVDEDMVLEPHAVRTLYEEALKKHAFVVYPLWDPHLDMMISGLKIYEHSIFAKFAYDEEMFSCEREQLDRVVKEGHSCEFKELNNTQALGVHSPEWTPYLIFQRYKSLTEKRRWGLRGTGWVDALLNKFLSAYQDDPSELNFFAMSGVISGLASDESNFVGERDSRTFAREEFQRLKNLWRE